MPNLIFISYRRTDNPFAGRIRDRLVAAFGASRVFKDSYNIGHGDDFPEKIKSALNQCDVMLVLISATWLNATETSDKSVVRRLDNPDDWVRREIAFALDRGNVRIIPILVQRANMPSPNELPDALRELANKNAVELRDDPYFDRDIADLINGLQDRSLSASSTRRFPVGAALTIAIILIAVIGFVVFTPRLFSAAAATATATLTPSPVAPTATLTPTLNVPPTGTATQSIQLDITATEIMLQRTVDAKKTANAVLLAESTHLAETANAVPTSTPVPSNTPKPSVTPVPPTLTPVTAASASGQLHVFASRESLTLYVAQSVSLLGFQFGVIVDSKLKLNALADSFDVLTLSGGQADVNDCYIYQADGTASPLSQSCKGRVFRTTVAAADVFWYDGVTNLPRNLAIFRDGQTTGTICSATIPDCAVIWASVTPSIPTQVPTFTPVPATVIPLPTNTLQTSSQAPSVGSYPCPATIVDNTGNATILNQIRSEPVYATSAIGSVRVGQAVSVLKKELEGSRTVWYQIGNDQGKAIGYILEDYVRLSPSCPQ